MIKNYLFDDGVFYFLRVILWMGEGNMIEHNTPKYASMKRHMLLSVATWVIIAISLIVTSSVALLIRQKEKELEFLVSNIVVSADIYFLQANDDKYYPQDLHLGSDRIDPRGMLEVDVTDPNAINYISKLRVNVTFKGLINSYVRVKFYQEWYSAYDIFAGYDEFNQPIILNTGSILRSVNAPYIINLSDSPSVEGWYDNRLNDNYLYYNTVVNSFDQVDYLLTIPLINGFDNSEGEFPLLVNNRPNITHSYQVTMAFIVEAVQVNRYQAIWNKTELPFE